MAAATPTAAPPSPFFTRLRRWMKPPRRIRFTAQGVWLILLTLGVGFAALNTGNNLLYVVLGMMLTLIGVSGILSELSVGGLWAERRLPREVISGQEVGVALCLHNRKALLPAIGVRVSEGPRLDADVEAAWFVHVGRRSEDTRIARYTFRRRGRHVLGALWVETSYPFGLFRRGYRTGPEDEIVVWPALRPVPDDDLRSRAGDGAEEMRRRGRGDEFFGLRAFGEGDDVRRVHWKISARRDRWMVRENAEQARQRVTVRFEPGPSPDLVGFEDGVGLCASYVNALITRGFEVGWEGPAERVAPAGGRPQLQRLMNLLALLAPGEGVTAAAQGREERIVVRVVGVRAVVSAGGGGA